VKVWDLAKIKAWDTAVSKKDPAVKPVEPEKGPPSGKFRVLGFAMSPDGTRFVTAGQDNVVRLWETATGKELRKWDFRMPAQVSRSFVRNLAYAPDGKFAVTANANATLYLLELP
jgi:WD40 repeat protein